MSGDVEVWTKRLLGKPEDLRQFFERVRPRGRSGHPVLDVDGRLAVVRGARWLGPRELELELLAYHPVRVPSPAPKSSPGTGAT